MHKDQTTVLSVRLSRDTLNDLEKLATYTKRSKSFLAAEAVSAYIALHLRHTEDIAQAQHEANDERNFVSYDAVESWVRSWGKEGRRR